ncbi:MAG: hypothetical protein AAGA66_15640 [Bacteroidota bacterium]
MENDASIISDVATQQKDVTILLQRKRVNNLQGVLLQNLLMTKTDTRSGNFFVLEKVHTVQPMMLTKACSSDVTGVGVSNSLKKSSDRSVPHYKTDTDDFTQSKTTVAKLIITKTQQKWKPSKQLNQSYQRE